MTENLYKSLLEERLRQLIDKDPKRAKRLLTDNPEVKPVLYEIGTDGQPKDWPILIVTSDPMQAWLDQINWSEGTSLSLSPSELPDLEAITEALPL